MHTWDGAGSGDISGAEVQISSSIKASFSMCISTNVLDELGKIHLHSCVKTHLLGLPVSQQNILTVLQRPVVCDEVAAALTLIGFGSKSFRPRHSLFAPIYVGRFLSLVRVNISVYRCQHPRRPSECCDHAQKKVARGDGKASLHSFGNIGRYKDCLGV